MSVGTLNQGVKKKLRKLIKSVVRSSRQADSCARVKRRGFEITDGQLSVMLDVEPVTSGHVVTLRELRAAARSVREEFDEAVRAARGDPEWEGLFLKSA